MKMIQKGLLRVCFQPITMLNCCTTCISWEIGSYNTQQSAIMNIRTFDAILSRNPQHDFPKMRGGGQRPFGTFPKFHPFWCAHPSLMIWHCWKCKFTVPWTLPFCHHQLFSLFTWTAVCSNSSYYHWSDTDTQIHMWWQLVYVNTNSLSLSSHAIIPLSS